MWSFQLTAVTQEILVKRKNHQLSLANSQNHENKINNWNTKVGTKIVPREKILWNIKQKPIVKTKEFSVDG